MAFPAGVANEALVACGRRCCLCHRFCGTNIELHHIVQKESGGEDSFDNCIPLCFDCHADVGHYNAKHPKGRKYSEEELRAHRDDWFGRMNRPEGELMPEHIAADRQTYLRLTFDGKLDESMEFVRGHDYGCDYLDDLHDPLDRFEIEGLSPFNEFFLTDLECARSDLRKVAAEFTSFVGLNTFPCRGRRGDRWRETYTEDVCRDHPNCVESIRKMNDLSYEVWEAYCQYIRIARRHLIAV